MNFLKKKPRKTNRITLKKYNCRFLMSDGSRGFANIDKWCTEDECFLTNRVIEDGYIKSLTGEVYPIGNIISFHWYACDEKEIEYYEDQIDVFFPRFPSDEYIEHIRVKE